ncbi:MAG: PIN domain-containing protein [Bacteroidota bacterium]
MAKYVLVDSSIWVNYFRSGSNNFLDQLISEDLVCTNELILTELLPALKDRGYSAVIEGLLALPRPALNIDWDIIRRYQVLNLKHGVNKVGIPDLIILQQVIDAQLSLMSSDKHFKLMNKYLQFELLRPD